MRGQEEEIGAKDGGSVNSATLGECSSSYRDEMGITSERASEDRR